MITQVIILTLLFITAIIGTIKYSNYRETYLKYFIYFLWYGVLTELAGHYIGFILRKSTFYIYNIYIFISTFFYLLLFYSYIKKNKFYIKLLLLLFILLYVSNILFFQKTIQVSQTYSILVGSIFIVISIVILFAELLNSDIILKINRSLLFWVIIGALIFHVGIIPIFVMADFFDYYGFFDYMILGLNIITCLCFITGFLLSEKKYNL